MSPWKGELRVNQAGRRVAWFSITVQSCFGESFAGGSENEGGGDRKRKVGTVGSSSKGTLVSSTLVFISPIRLGFQEI